MSHQQRLIIVPTVPPIPTRLNNNQVQLLLGVQEIEKAKQMVKNISSNIYRIVTENKNIVYVHEEITVNLQKNYQTIQELFVKYKQCLVNVKIHVVDQLCSICTEKCSDMVILEECKHTFCRECILKWADNNNVKCPNCRGVSVFLFRNQPLIPLYDPFEDMISRYYGMTDEKSVKSEIIQSIFETVEGLFFAEKLCFIRQNRDSIKNKQSFIRLGSIAESSNRIYFLLQLELQMTNDSVNNLFEKLRKIEMYYAREKFDLEVTDWCFLQVQQYLEQERYTEDEKLAQQLQAEIRRIRQAEIIRIIQSEIIQEDIRQSEIRPPHRHIPSLIIFPAEDDVYIPSSPLYVQRRRNIIQTPVSP